MATPTTAGTAELSVVVLVEATPTVTVPDPDGIVESTLEGHTRIPLAGTVAVSLLLVGVTMNVSVVDAAGPVYVAESESEPEPTLVPSALNVPVDETSALAGVTAPNVTGTAIAVPDKSVSPVANVPRLTVVASTTAAIGSVLSVAVRPSGARTTTANRTEPDEGATDPSVYRPIDTAFAVASNVKLATVPYSVPVATESTARTERTALVGPESESTIELVFPSPHTTVPPSVAFGP